jgi:hypothetical protein
MRALSTALALALATTQAFAAKLPSTCTMSADREAFDTMALKNELTVTALTCHDNAKFNDFMHAYQPALVADQKDLSAYFKRAYGKQAAKQYDSYITELSLAQSEAGLKSGTAFCGEFESMFDEVMSLHSATELPDFARSQGIVQPIEFTDCPAAPTKAVRTRRHSAHKKA